MSDAFKDFEWKSEVYVICANPTRALWWGIQGAAYWVPRENRWDMAPEFVRRPFPGKLDPCECRHCANERLFQRRRRERLEPR